MHLIQRIFFFKCHKKCVLCGMSVKFSYFDSHLRRQHMNNMVVEAGASKPSARGSNKSKQLTEANLENTDDNKKNQPFDWLVVLEKGWRLKICLGVFFRGLFFPKFLTIHVMYYERVNKFQLRDVMVQVVQLFSINPYRIESINNND